VDLEARIYRLRRTKAGKGRVVVLNDIALATLRRAEAYKAPDGKYVFPAPTKQGHLMDVRGAFKRARKKAGIRNDFRLHDLRHTFASLAVGAGVSLFEVQKLLGHASSQMTQKYAHLRDETLRRATDTVAAQIGLATAADDAKVDEVAPAA
jgi:integrase